MVSLRLLALSASIAAGPLLAPSASAQVRITEFLYNGLDGEFIELTNVGAADVDLTGWSLDDQTAMAGTFDLSMAGVLAPGGCVVVTDRIAANFAANWSLTGVTVLGGNALAPIGRNDEIHLYDGTGTEVDLIRYGDEDYPGSVRALGASANVCTDALGIDDIYRWTLGSIGDDWMTATSANGDLGNPGVHVDVACPPIGVSYCVSPANSTGQETKLEIIGSPSVALNDLELRCTRMPLNSVGYFLVATEAGFVPNAGGSAGTLCIGGSIGRYSPFAMNSGGAGEISLVIDLNALAQPNGPITVLPGESWFFQAWHRDMTLGFPTSNFSDGVEVEFR